jgi:hypothetical protein
MVISLLSLKSLRISGGCRREDITELEEVFRRVEFSSESS